MGVVKTTLAVTHAPRFCLWRHALLCGRRISVINITHPFRYPKMGENHETQTVCLSLLTLLCTSQRNSRAVLGSAMDNGWHVDFSEWDQVCLEGKIKVWFYLLFGFHAWLNFCAITLAGFFRPQIGGLLSFPEHGISAEIWKIWKTFPRALHGNTRPLKTGVAPASTGQGFICQILVSENLRRKKLKLTSCFFWCHPKGKRYLGFSFFFGGY